MLTLIIGLIILSFLEATWLKFSLVILVLIIRSFISPQRSNYYLAFGFGLLLGSLTHQTLGVLSLFFLILVKIIHLIRTSQFVSYWLFILPLTLGLLLLFYFLEMLIFKSNVSLSIILIQMILVLPIYILVRFWEERFVPQKEIRLKVKG